jgi:hypothetical protein
MPLYEYSADNGATVLLRRPVDLRDAPVIIDGARLRRRTVPSRITVGTGARPETHGAKIARGYKHLEDTGQLVDRPNYLPAAAVKQAIAMPDPVEAPALT